MNKTPLAAGAAVLSFILASPALADDASDPTRAASTSTAPAPTAPTRLGDMFAQYGVKLRASVINETAMNPSGGVDQSSSNVGQLQLGADFDLQRIVGIPGASIHLTEYHDYGTSLSLDAIGNGVRVQEIYKNPYNHWHFGLFTYEQKLFDDKVDIAVGRTATSAYFGHLDQACLFMTGANCGIPALLNSEAGFSLLPSGTWGGKISYNITPHLYVMTGGFEVDSFMQNTSGFDFGTSHATGVTVPVEVGYGTTFANDRYPFDVKAGGYYSDGGHTDPFYNTAHRALGTFGGAAETIDNRSGIYVLADKTVWRGEDSAHNVTMFGGWAQPFDKTEVYTSQVFAGAVWSGPLAARPKDTVGFVANYFRVSDEEVAFLHDARVKAGGTGTNSPNEFMFELNYGVQLMRGVKLTPNIQYIVNPDNSALPHTRELTRDVLVLGLKLSIDLGDMPY
jgi:porin